MRKLPCLAYTFFVRSQSLAQSRCFHCLYIQGILFPRELLIFIVGLPCLVVGTLTGVGREVHSQTGVGGEIGTFGREVGPHSQGEVRMKRQAHHSQFV